MFPDGYFAPGYFAPGYFSRVTVAPAITRIIVIFGSLDTEIDIAGKITTEMTITGSLDTEIQTYGRTQSMAGSIRASCYRRERIIVTHTVEDVDLTGQTWILEILPPGSDTPLVRKTATASGDSVSFTLTSTDTTQTAGVYDITISRPGETTEAMGAEGTFEVKQRRVALP